MADRYPRPRGGFPGGALLVLVMTVVLVIAVVVVMSQDPPPPPAAADRTAPAGSTPPDDQPSLPPDWVQLTPEPEDTESPEPTVEPGVTAEPNGTPVSSGFATAGTPPTTSSPYSFTAVAGNGCAETAVAGSFAGFPAGSPVPSRLGGWRGSGCAGGLYWSVSMSGDANRDDDGVQVTWWFRTGTLTRGSCAFWVFVPGSDSATEVAGKPTFYQVIRGRDDATVVGTFTVDQTASRGSWVPAGRYALERGQIAVKLLNRGVGAQGARHAAAQIQAACGA